MSPRETPEDDDRRTVTLLDSLDAASELDSRASFDAGSFESIVTDGLACGPACADYPPAGHTYPRKG